MGKSALSGRYLPVRIKPQPDELLSSWLTRLSLAHGLTLRAFCPRVWPTARVWGKAVDWRSSETLLTGLAEKTALPRPRLAAASLSAYEGWLVEVINPRVYPSWLLRNGMHRYYRRLPSLQYCPHCLRADTQPYFRRHWRLGFITVCAQHQRRLRDRCPKCRQPVNFHWLAADAPTLATCYRCGFDVRQARTRRLTNHPLHQRLIAFQTAILNTQTTAQYRLPVHGDVPAYDFFHVLRHLASVLIAHRQADDCRANLCRQLEMTDFQPRFLSRSRRAVELLAVDDRFLLMQLLAAWLDGWPDGFVDTSLSSRIWDRLLLYQLIVVPAWYRQTAQRVTWPIAMNRILQQVAREVPGGSDAEKTSWR